jgi:hypothetical protein
MNLDLSTRSILLVSTSNRLPVHRTNIEVHLINFYSLWVQLIVKSSALDGDYF